MFCSLLLQFGFLTVVVQDDVVCFPSGRLSSLVLVNLLLCQLTQRYPVSYWLAKKAKDSTIRLITVLLSKNVYFLRFATVITSLSYTRFLSETSTHFEYMYLLGSS